MEVLDSVKESLRRVDSGAEGKETQGQQGQRKKVKYFYRAMITQMIQNSMEKSLTLLQVRQPSLSLLVAYDLLAISIALEDVSFLHAVKANTTTSNPLFQGHTGCINQAYDKLSVKLLCRERTPGKRVDRLVGPERFYNIPMK
ncbi:hypothetical protein NDU88_007821 [Pleurodeles waltl]|uniref:Uncharacterized protein n=1 Tax=Pleurodeles waltl TaxID=8319 RepID=A0AAV7N6H1_PLEWA|nr:hypothetical protein NDU88_007821 [Pleurodeles waltl]